MPSRRAFALLVALISGGSSCHAPAPPVMAPPRIGFAPKSSPAHTLDLQAAVAEEQGIADVAAEYRRRAYEAAPSPERKLEWARALEHACAFERAQPLYDELREARRVQPAGPVEPEPRRVEGAISALASNDPRAARDAIGTSPSAPLELELLGRAEWALGDHVLARKRWACARSRIDASGGKLGMLLSAAGSVEHLDWHDGRLLVARTRERYLNGGYQSSRTHSVWIEEYVPGDRDPLVRWSVGNLDGFAISADRRSVALIDRPVDMMIAPVPTTARLFDARTGRELASWSATDMHRLQLGPGPGSLLAADQHGVVMWDMAGKAGRTFPLSGSTPGVMRVYRGPGTYHDNIPISYPSAPAAVASAPNGTVVVGATDGTLWMWKGTGAPVQLKAWSTPPGDEREAMRRKPIAMSIDDAGANLLLVRGDGAIVAWDLVRRQSKVVADPRCTDAEAQAGVYGSGPITPEALAECAQARTAAITPDRSRVILASLMGAARVRDGRDGHAIAVLDTLEADAASFVDVSGARVWLGGVEGSITEWATQSGKSVRALAQGGVHGFLHGLSNDGRYVAVAEALEGYHTRTTPVTRVWDTASRRPVEGLGPLGWVRFAADKPVMVASGSTGAFVWDFATGKATATLDAKNEAGFELSADATRIVGLKDKGKIVVRDLRGVLREIDLGATPWAFGIDRTARTAAAVSETDELTVWNLDDGRNLLRASAPRGSMVALSPDGRRVAWRAGSNELVVTSVEDRREIARIASKDLVPDQDYQPIRACEFVSEDTLLLVGPGAPGYERIFRWKIGAAATPTELQVLGGERMQIASSGIATVYDRNEMAHLLRVSDGVLLASVHATRGGAWLAVSRAGAVDGPPDGQSALITTVEGPVRAGGSSLLGWDRFAVTGLLQRASAGQVVAPPMPGTIERTDTLR